MFIVMVLHAATSSDSSGESYLSGYIRALFVLALMGMMGALFLIIKARDFMEKRRHTKAIKQADKEWVKFRGGVGLIRRHNQSLREKTGDHALALLTGGSSPSPPEAAGKKVGKVAWMMKELADREKHKAADELAMFGHNEPQNEHPDTMKLRSGSASAFLCVSSQATRRR